MKTREFGQPPRMIAFGGRDTMNVLFWNPMVWQDDMDSRVFPDKSLPNFTVWIGDDGVRFAVDAIDRHCPC